MVILQILAAIAITAVVILVYDHREEKREQEARRAANRAHTLNLFINNRLKEYEPH